MNHDPNAGIGWTFAIVVGLLCWGSFIYWLLH